LRAAALGVGLAIVAALVVWTALPTTGPGSGDSATEWVRAGDVDELRARRIVYLEEIETFVVAPAGEEPFALSASSPHLGDRLLFCRSAGWFFSPAHGETFDLHGAYELGPADAGMSRRETRLVEGGLEVLAGSETPGTAEPADAEPSGPLCTGGTGPEEDEPGFAGLTGAVADSHRYPLEVIEGVTPGASIGNPGFVGMEVGFTAPAVVVRLVGVDGSILDERIARCDPGPCPDYAYSELIFDVEATQRATVLIGVEEGGEVVWVHHVPVVLEPMPGVEPGSFVGTWYDEFGKPTYFKDADGWHLELHVITGADHCGWESASFLTLAWPVGTEVQPSGEGARFYVRDPEGVLAASFDVPSPDLAAELPPDAEPTGYRRGDWSLWTGPGDPGDAVYLVSDDGSVEQWPRVDRAIACA
jgi:nitrite reductase/ring-hydroxylating ferredoxin subunit